MNFVEDLRWRGLIQDIMPGTEEELSKGMVSGYIGFDPTAESLHVGSLSQIFTLVRFQQAGHKPLALVGGATGMIGDPTGKSQERNLLSEEELAKNLKGIQKQLEQFLDFDCGANSAEIVNNYDWFKNYSFLDFIRDAGKHITVNYMMAKDSVKKRLESEVGMSFTEFTYQLIQGFDFYHLWKERNVKLQMGGSDQWGNIVTGTEFIRRKAQGQAFALTSPLIKKADGTKFGKTEGGNIWLDPKRTSPYQFYQFWLNATDEDVKNYIKIFTFMTKEEVDALIAEHDQAPHLRVLQKSLAEDITRRVHGEQALQTALKTTDFLFGNGSLEFLNALSDEEVIGVFEGIAQFKVDRSAIDSGVDVVSLLAEKTQIFPSKGEAKKMIQGGGVSINREKVGGPDVIVSTANLVNNKFIVAQKGKKNYFLIIAE
ncbi:tyrosyl-tRNA synthetase [Pseudopedobacter saltans DSM 12145]|uniref:Tyrosine--tRNA ligase n=1 Tax=Pseudopedobacter saltans (strain ATCC 51119 / DSM 12145 / JCM 21818 / CCUG 39354 / LMG 10337 / NBRC 100064 / NCIMB 13643) TaxID=762903 RepID=F0SDL8_PSESL|nr:tyrosine--tRNA ligase [Pseudopedobacter saltans]ADY50745.1 tyrosyl-tRNA synthetase [Pseudopedobacter saltans DSM 12145]